MTAGSSLPESPAFLAAIAANPDDDLPRLVYADWLDENGDPDRAEFIRVQIELAKLMSDDPRRESLTARGKELLAAHRDQWRLPQFRDAHQEFNRGFVDHIRATGKWLLAHPTALPATPLVRSLKVTNAMTAGMELAQVRGLEQIVHLDLANTFIGRGFNITDFLSTARLERLRGLNLGQCGFWPWAIPQLVEVERLLQLDRLVLWGNPFSDDGLELIAGSPNLANLTTLDLSAHEQSINNCVHSQGAMALATSETLTKLRVLDLTDHYIGDDGLSALTNSPNARSLERLVVSYNEIGLLGDSGIEAMVQSPHLGNLRELVFIGNRLDPLGAEALAGWSHLEQMRFVDLQECGLGEMTRNHLLASPCAEKFVL